MAYVKGAPERLLPRCGRIFGDDGERELAAAELALVQAALDSLAAGGLRLLAVAERPLDRALEVDGLAIDGLDEQAEIVERT